MIEPNQDPVDFIHLTDLYTTAARLGGAMDNIPSDRVVDGIDQTSLLLLGDGHSRRNYMFHYSGGNLGAVRYKDIKALITGPGHGGLPGLSHVQCYARSDRARGCLILLSVDSHAVPEYREGP